MQNSKKEVHLAQLLSAILMIMVVPSFLFFFNSCQRQFAQQENLLKYLPAEVAKEWKKKDVSRQYEGEDLFLYIDGGAEIYNEYGFERVIVQEYINENGKSVSLEIFEMSSPESAFGIYTFKVSPQGRKLSVGDQCLLEDYYLNFWKGKFLVTLTGFDEDEETIQGLREIAHAVDSKIKNTGDIPCLVTLIPDEDLMESSIKYFKGNLGLSNSYSFFKKNVFLLKEGVKGDYVTGFSIFIIKYESDEECQEIFDNVKENFKESSRYRNYQAVEELGIQVVDSEERLISVSPFKRYILIVVGAGSSQIAEKALNLIKEKIKNRR